VKWLIKRSKFSNVKLASECSHGCITTVQKFGKQNGMIQVAEGVTGVGNGDNR